MTTSLRHTQALRFSPSGLSDSLDETDLFPGAMAVLQNLIPDPTTKNVWTCRPASVLQTNFAGFTAPGTIACFKVVGSLVYGLIASGRKVNYDEPFCFNLLTGAFVPVSGITAANVPATQTTVGDWTPPTMDAAGVNLIVTHPGFDGVTNFFGWFDTSNPGAPVWHAGNTAAGSLISFTTVPAWVAQFNGRAYFGINPPTGQPSVVFTDSLTLKVTNANQALTFGDNLMLTAAMGLPLNNQLGGVIQALLVFKAAGSIYQVTGDYQGSTLAINTLNTATGTLSPRSIVDTPNGVGFLAPDGFRIIDFDAHVSDPIGVAGAGINVPFLQPLYPSRVAASCNADVIRISIQNQQQTSSPFQEYWFDLPRKVWSGPHTFPAAAIDVYQNAFIVAPVSAPGTLFLSATTPINASSVIENGVALTWTWQTAVLADNTEMSMSEAVEMQLKTTQNVGMPAFTLVAQDENGASLGSVVYSFAGEVSNWGSAVWGVAVWGGYIAALYPRQISFPAPVVYNRLSIKASGPSCIGFRIGDMFIRRRVLGYMQATP